MPQDYPARRLITAKHITALKAFMQGRGRPATPSRDPQAGSPRQYAKTPQGTRALQELSRRSRGR